jgi:hypothetical protein
MNRRRPAAAGVGRRRPAAAIEEAPVRGRRVVDPEEAYSRGEVVKAHQLPPTLLDRGHWIVSEASTYFGEECKWAGKVSRVTIEAGESELQVELTGTQSEALLKFASGLSPPVIRAHLCKEGCDQKRVNPDLVHLSSFRKLAEGAEKTWEVNLVGTDENAPLRRVEEAWRERVQEGREAQVDSSPSSSGKKKQKKKKKSKKKDSEKKAKKAKRIGGRTVAKKSLSQLFEGTGLDPDHVTRKKVTRKVRRRLRKSRSSSSSSSSSTSSSSLPEADKDILEDRSKIQKIATLGPGILSASAIQSMKQFVLQAGGSTCVIQLPLPKEVTLELARFLGLIPLAYMDFRCTVAKVVTASDASKTGGGVTASSSLTPAGCVAAQCGVRGDIVEPAEVTQVVTVGLFDGIGALRTKNRCSWMERGRAHQCREG